MSLGPITLPFQGDQYSFSLNFASPESAERPDFELSLVAFDYQGKLDDTVYSRKPTALDGAVAKASEPQALPETCASVEGDDVIHVFPKLLVRKVEVLLLVASAARKPGRAYDLSFSNSLEFTVNYWNDAGDPVSEVLDLKPKAGELSGGSSVPSEQWVSSIIVGAIYITAQGWIFGSLSTTHPHDNVGALIPDLKRAVVSLGEQYGVRLEAAQHMEISESDRMALTRQWEDTSLEAAATGTSVTPRQVTKLRIDLSWTFWPPKKTEEDEEPLEDPPLEFNLVMYNKEGEEVQSIGTNNREAEGCTAGRPEPEEQEEEEAAEEKEEEAKEGEEGEEGEEGKEPPPPPPPPPPPKIDPYEFKERDVVYLTLAEVPSEVVSMLLVVSHYDEERGFAQVRSVRCRVHDISDGEDEAALRTLADYGHLSKYEMDKEITQILLMKMYKEYGSTAYNLFASAGLQNMAAYISQDPEVLKPALKAYMESTKKSSEELAKTLADAEENGDEITTDLRPHTWRYRALGITLKGDSLQAEVCEHDVKNAMTYDGVLAPGEARACGEARVQFQNGDSYFGSYKDDLKHGPGLYAFASGAVYTGEYVAGKREGHGVMAFPDGGTYVGGWKADRFSGHGQYRYPDGSVYTGSWAEGKKHGPGIYWDTAQGCLRGEWVKGILQGKATYNQPAYVFEGDFKRGVPAGPGAYTLCAHRTLGQPKFAAAHILAMEGPSLTAPCVYTIPPGSGDDPQIDEDGNEVEDPDKPPLPTFPKYEGLTFAVDALPQPAAQDPVFPPPAGLVPVPDAELGVPLVAQVAAFTAEGGLFPAPVPQVSPA